MNFLADIYNESLAKNEENLRFWENYLQNLRALDFSVYADKLKVPALVPVGSKILFRGELKHTNEVTVALGADYFVKCSLAQAEVLRQHRIKGAESKVEALQKEREYIQNQLLFSTDNVFKEQGQEIFEEYTEEEDLKWREKHRENMRLYKQKGKDEEPREKISDEDLWFRLEELELKEELEEEMANMDKVPDRVNKNIFNKQDRPLSVPEENDRTSDKHTFDHQKIGDEQESNKSNNKEEVVQGRTCKKHKLTEEVAPPRNNSKLELLQQVIEKQNELKEKLIDLRNKETAPSQTEKDLITKLDEMELLDELEDEMDRLDDVLQSEHVEESEEENVVEDHLKSPAAQIKRSVSFADEDTSETLELTFSHSETEPDTAPYDKEKGITKPSDVYSAFSDLFSETTSILKKSKYERDFTPSGLRVEKRTKVNDFQEAEDNRQMNKTIVLNDVVEKVDENDNSFDGNVKRPMSLFKKRRQQNLR